VVHLFGFDFGFVLFTKTVNITKKGPLAIKSSLNKIHRRRTSIITIFSDHQEVSSSMSDSGDEDSSNNEDDILSKSKSKNSNNKKTPPLPLDTNISGSLEGPINPINSLILHRLPHFVFDHHCY
jgi:hypothetical protein